MKIQIAISMILLIVSFAQAEFHDNLIAYYPFDGDADDKSGHGNHCITHHVDLVEGISGQAYYFSGIGNWHGSGDSSFIEIDGSGTYNYYTVSMWVKAAEGAHAQFFSDAHGAGSQSHGRPDIGIYSGRFYILASGSGTGKATSLLTGYDDDQWHHVVGTVNTPADTVQLYVDGEFQRQVSRIPAYPLILNNGGSSDYRVDIGARSRKNSYFKGTVDEVSIFNKVLSAEEIQELFESMSESYPVVIDIKPDSFPNPINVKSQGVLPAAVLGSADLDVSEIVATSIRLNGVEAVRDGYEDVATNVIDANDCSVHTSGPDGYIDLVLKFKTQDIVQSLGEVDKGDVLTLELTGVLVDETPIAGQDCIVIVGNYKPINKADINKDGVVNTIDMTIVAENWLKSSIVE